MKKIVLLIACCIALLTTQFVTAQNNDALDKYIQHLRDDHAGPLKETGFLTAGSDFLYGQDYFEAGKYASAEGYFMDVVKKQKGNAFANYQLGISLIRQDNAYKKQQSRQYFEAAIAINPSLKERYKKDVPEDTAADNPQPAIPGNTPVANTTPTGLEAYINRLKYSRATRGAETAMNTAGQQALYGIEYYEVNEFGSAETEFALALASDASNPYLNYLMAVSMAARGKENAAQPYLQKAIARDALLQERFALDVPRATANWQKLVDSRKVKTTPAVTAANGGALVFGNYTCDQTVWNGPKASPAYSYQYKGYFALKDDGTYRWLDNGATGKYKYDTNTGTITWLSGYFKTTGAKSTLYKRNNETVQMTVSFTDSYRWECGCKKK